MEWLEIGPLADVMQWFDEHETAGWWMAGISLVMFVGTLVAGKIFVVRIPADYFTHPERHQFIARERPVLRIGLKILGNLVGVIFVVAGILMLVLPGQGILTIIVGLLLISFPGKYRLERWLVSRGPVERRINRMRRKSGKEPLET